MKDRAGRTGNPGLKPIIYIGGPHTWRSDGWVAVESCRSKILCSAGPLSWTLLFTMKAGLVTSGENPKAVILA